MQHFAFHVLRASAALALVLLVASSAQAEPMKIVAIGASNTAGWGVGPEKSFVGQLATLLKGRGYNIEFRNNGVPGRKTATMLEHLDFLAPVGTQLVVLQPGSNDRRAFVTKEQRTANIAEIVRRLRARNIRVVVYDRDVPHHLHQWDGIHFNVEGHTLIATQLLPEIIAALGPRSRLEARR